MQKLLLRVILFALLSGVSLTEVRAGELGAGLYPSEVARETTWVSAELGSERWGKNPKGLGFYFLGVNCQGLT